MLEGHILCKSLKLPPDPVLAALGLRHDLKLFFDPRDSGLRVKFCSYFFLICRKQEILWLGFFSIFLSSLTNFSVNFNICYSLLANKMSPAGRPQKE